MWCVVKNGKYLKVQEQHLYEELKKQYLKDHQEPPEMLAGGFLTFDKADEKKQEIALARAKEERETKAREKEAVAHETAPVVAHPVDAKEKTETAEGTAAQTLLGPDFVQDDAMATMTGKQKEFTGEQFVRNHPRETLYIVRARFVYKLSLDAIAEIIGCSPQTVQAVCTRQAGMVTIQEFKDMTTKRLRDLVHVTIDMLEKILLDPEKMAKMEPKDAVWIARTVMDWWQRLEEEKQNSPNPGGANDASKKIITEEDKRRAREVLASMTPVVEVGPVEKAEGDNARTERT